jgi:hypothetical protein
MALLYMPIQYLDARCYFLSPQMRKWLLVTRPTTLGIVSLENIRFCREAYTFVLLQYLWESLYTWALLQYSVLWGSLYIWELNTIFGSVRKPVYLSVTIIIGSVRKLIYSVLWGSLYTCGLLPYLVFHLK